ncbi:hypothetical protein [Streptomyces sp. UG1]|uniref:hypothetical protein n=1 Tax=Streptomyces sp. UG1 TaxID=3417652 RepID=UPI003CEDD26E
MSQWGGAAEGAQQVPADPGAANFRKDNVFHEELRQSVGNGLLTSQDEPYARQRRLIQPLFTRRRVNGHASQVGTGATAPAAAWRAASDGSAAGDIAELVSDP